MKGMRRMVALHLRGDEGYLRAGAAWGTPRRPTGMDSLRNGTANLLATETPLTFRVPRFVENLKISETGIPPTDANLWLVNR